MANEGNRGARPAGRPRGGAWPSLLLAAAIALGAAAAMAGCAFFRVGTGKAGRPEGNDGAGFFVKEGKIYSPDGIEFLPMGYNVALNHCALAAEYRANAVRIVSVTPWYGAEWPTTFQQHRDAVASAVEEGLVPILEMHDATGDVSDDIWRHVVDYWKSPETVRLAKDYERYLWLNIANEHNFASPEAWRDEYERLIGELRELGVKNLIVLDADSAWGQSPNGIKLYGPRILESDPQRNVLFSIHVYTYWKTTLDPGYRDVVGSWNTVAGGGGDPWLAEEQFEELRSLKLPIILGEFGWHLPASEGVGANGEGLVAAVADSGYGFLFWELLNWPGEYYRPYTILLGQEGNDNGPPYALAPAGEYLVPYLAERAARASVFP